MGGRLSGKIEKPPAILETALYCPDLVAAKAFYSGKLGLKIITEGGNRHVFFRLDNSVLLIFNPAETINPPAGSNNGPHGAIGPGHACFGTTPLGYEYWLERIKTLGIEIESQIVWPNGARSFYFRDPAGNSLEFAEPKLWGL